MRCLVLARAPALATIVLCLTSVARSQTQYIVSDITGGDETRYGPTRIGDDGTAIGTGQGIAYAYNQALGFQPIPDLEGNFVLSSVFPRGVSNDGHVVGFVDMPTGRHAFIWDHVNGTREIHDWEPTRHMAAYAVNDKGEILGRNEYNDIRNWVWDPVSQSLSYFDKLDGNECNVIGFNSNGVAAGWGADRLGEQTAVRWKDGRIVWAGQAPGGYASQFDGVNNLGTAYGNTFTNGGVLSFVQYADGSFQYVDNPYSDDFTLIHGFNDQDVGVGRLRDGSGQQRAMVWDPANGAKILNDLLAPGQDGWNIKIAMDINNQGQIVGSGEFHGEYRGVLLTPVVPEPSILLLGAGLGLVLLKRRRVQ